MPLEIPPVTLSLSVGKHRIGMLDTSILRTLRFDMRNNEKQTSRAESDL